MGDNWERFFEEICRKIEYFYQFRFLGNLDILLNIIQINVFQKDKYFFYLEI